LLDEIEKAHPDLFNILLQVMDHGTLTDNNGAETDFRNVILIMTCNLGGREMNSKPIGFGERSGPLPKQAVEKAFSPEFRNRLDAVLAFAPLSQKTMLRVVDKFIDELTSQLEERHIRIRLSSAARRQLAERGYDPRYGARPLGRLVQQEISDPLASEILFGALKNGGVAQVGFRQGKFCFDYTRV